MLTAVLFLLRPAFAVRRARLLILRSNFASRQAARLALPFWRSSADGGDSSAHPAPSALPFGRSRSARPLPVGPRVIGWRRRLRPSSCVRRSLPQACAGVALRLVRTGAPVLFGRLCAACQLCRAAHPFYKV